MCLLLYVQSWTDDGRKLLYVQSWAPDDGRKDRPKHVECHSRINKFDTVVHLFGFAIEIYYDARPYERQICILWNPKLHFIMSLCCTSGPYPKRNASGWAVQSYCFNIHRTNILLCNPSCVKTDHEYKLRISSYAVICFLMSHPFSHILSTVF